MFTTSQSSAGGNAAQYNIPPMNWTSAPVAAMANTTIASNGGGAAKNRTDR